MKEFIEIYVTIKLQGRLSREGRRGDGPPKICPECTVS